MPNIDHLKKEIGSVRTLLEKETAGASIPVAFLDSLDMIEREVNEMGIFDEELWTIFLGVRRGILFAIGQKEKAAPHLERLEEILSEIKQLEELRISSEKRQRFIEEYYRELDDEIETIYQIVIEYLAGSGTRKGVNPYANPYRVVVDLYRDIIDNFIEDRTARLREFHLCLERELDPVLPHRWERAKKNIPISQDLAKHYTSTERFIIQYFRGETSAPESRCEIIKHILPDPFSAKYLDIAGDFSSQGGSRTKRAADAYYRDMLKALGVISVGRRPQDPAKNLMRCFQGEKEIYLSRDDQIAMKKKVGTRIRGKKVE